MGLTSEIKYRGRPCDDEEYRVKAFNPHAEDEEVLASTEWQCATAQQHLQIGKIQPAVLVLRRAFRTATKQIEAARGGGPAAKLALALIRLHLCSALARLGKRTQMLAESQVALREVDEVWRTLLRSASVSKHSTLGTTDPLAAVLKRPPAWLDRAAEAAVRVRLYVAMSIEAVAREEGGIQAILSSAARAGGKLPLADMHPTSSEEEDVLEVSNTLEDLFIETTALARHLLPEGHPLTHHVERAHEEADLPLEVSSGAPATSSSNRPRSQQHTYDSVGAGESQELDFRILETKRRLPKVPADIPGEATSLSSFGLQLTPAAQSGTRRPPKSSSSAQKRRPRASTHLASTVPGARDRAAMDPFEAWKRSVSDHQVMTPFQRSLQSEEGVRYLQDTLRHQSRMFRVVVLKDMQDHEPERLQENRVVYSNGAMLTKRNAERRMDWWKTSLEEAKPEAEEQAKTAQLLRQYGVRVSNSEPSLKHFVKLMARASPAEQQRKRVEAEERRRKDLEDRWVRDADKVALMQGQQQKPRLTTMGTSQWKSEPSSADGDEDARADGELAGARFVSMARKSVKKSHDIQRTAPSDMQLHRLESQPRSP